MLQLLAIAASGLGAAVFFTSFKRRPLMVLTLAWVYIGFSGAIASSLSETAIGPALQWADEVLLVAAFISTLLIRRFRLLRNPLGVTAAIAAVLYGSAGVLSGLMQGVAAAPLLIGTFLGMKFWLCLVIALAVTGNVTDEELSDGRRRFYQAVSSLVLIGLGTGAVNLLAPGPFLDRLGFEPSPYLYRFGYPSVQAFFDHPGWYGSFMTFAALLFFSKFSVTGRRSAGGWSGAALAGALASWRLKTLLAASAGVIGIMLGSSRRASSRALRSIIPAAAVLAMSLGGLLQGLITTQITTYLSADGDSNRQQLYRAGFSIAADEFPLGGGFGRFGSATSTQYYSPLYDRYGLSSTYGLSRESNLTAQDTAWASIIGETGVLGTGAFVFALAFIGRALRRSARKGKGYRQGFATAGFCLVAVAVLDGLALPVFSNSFYSLSVALVVGLGSVSQGRPAAPLRVDAFQPAERTH